MITHPNFRNFTSREAEDALAPASVEVGETIIRPSSRSNAILVATVKVGPALYMHIGTSPRWKRKATAWLTPSVGRSVGSRCRRAEIREDQKVNEWTLGRALYIGKDRFDDLDEVGWMSQRASDDVGCLEGPDGFTNSELRRCDGPDAGAGTPHRAHDVEPARDHCAPQVQARAARERWYAPRRPRWWR